MDLYSTILIFIYYVEENCEKKKKTDHERYKNGQLHLIDHKIISTSKLSVIDHNQAFRLLGKHCHIKQKNIISQS